MIAIHGGAGIHQNNAHKFCANALKECSADLVGAVMVFINFRKFLT